MIPTKPPPSFRNPDKWSTEFIDFVSKCLVKNPEQRATAKNLLKVSELVLTGLNWKFKKKPIILRIFLLSKCLVRVDIFRENII